MGEVVEERGVRNMEPPAIDDVVEARVSSLTVGRHQRSIMTMLVTRKNKVDDVLLTFLLGNRFLSP
jgi:hypothetical protein